MRGHKRNPAAAEEGEGGAVPPMQFPLYLDGSERTRFAYAIFLLNKVGCLLLPPNLMVKVDSCK